MDTTPSSDATPTDETFISPARRRWAVWSLALGAFAIGLTEFAVMGLMPQIARGIGGTSESVGLGISAYALGVVVGAPALTVVAGRLRRKHLALGLLAVFTLGNALTLVTVDPVTFAAARFVTGLPHGAYFGVAAVLARRVVPAGRAGRAIGNIQVGMTVANLVGVPGATWVGQHTDWRVSFAAITGLGAVTMLALRLAIPPRRHEPRSSARQEVTALRRPWVWVAFAIAATGLAGMFTVYSYIAPIVTSASGTDPALIPVVQAVFGLGMTLGAVAGGRLADWSAPRAIGIGLAAIAAALAVYGVVVEQPWAAYVGPFLIAFTCQLIGPSLQLTLMNAAPESPALAAALYHSAFNVANALGALTGGWFIAPARWHGPAWLGVVDALVALGVALVGWRILTRRGRIHDLFPAYR